ncbi:hypothetical protein CHLNCDRAFT_58960 [Chlorella variabilis]|uniref:Tyrosine specific protein phosphatases domain-containing protein n=1 Tax=Chlorella variabilis TaxID=554065 RepID=E1ZPG6_CHLVA|nr:hypothetical protein CHLNCDRAFT_58960 [Chlorella variabilis]EFN52274.1 hypothetical protein CHLNCDRAFT_58960 [Chlorella variabilis]|eukprot:XP_005844376.1 hypothetical protein CHLNCDRAFT_58960 [Chlorella variabilis]
MAATVASGAQCRPPAYQAVRPSSSGGSRRRCAPLGAAAAAAMRPPAKQAGATVQLSRSRSHQQRRRCRQAAALAEAVPEVAAVVPEAVPLPELAPLDENYESACAFADFANWLVPGRVMLGRYPFVEPSRCRSRDVGEEQLRRLLKAGVTTFVCLQAEIPEQGAMRICGVDGFVPYRAPATLLASALSPPPSMEEVAALRTPELDRYLPPRRHRAAWQSRARIQLDFCHFPIVDLSIPEADGLRLLLAELSQRLERGERLYVHCWGGRGRAGLVGATLLAQLYGLSADEALERVQRSFDTRQDGGRRSPETDEQHAFVRAFVEGSAWRP